MEKTLTPQEIDKALLDPAAVFKRPMDVVGVSGLDKEIRIEILRRWEYDALEIQVQDEEAPGPVPGSNLLNEVLEALNRLGARPQTENAPPTKHGGV